MRDSLVLVLGRRATAEGRRGFQPIRRGGAIPPNHLVAERLWNQRHSLGRPRDACRLHTFPGRSVTDGVSAPSLDAVLFRSPEIEIQRQFGHFSLIPTVAIVYTGENSSVDCTSTKGASLESPGQRLGAGFDQSPSAPTGRDSNSGLGVSPRWGFKSSWFKDPGRWPGLSSHTPSVLKHW